MSSDDRLLWILLAVAAIVLLVPFLSMALMMPMMGLWGWGQMSGGMWGGGGVWLWLLMWLSVLLVVGGGGYLLYRAVRRSSGRDTDTALEELRLTYARGELTDDEFEERYERLQRDQ